MIHHHPSPYAHGYHGHHGLGGGHHPHGGRGGHKGGHHLHALVQSLQSNIHRGQSVLAMIPHPGPHHPPPPHALGCHGGGAQHGHHGGGHHGHHGGGHHGHQEEDITAIMGTASVIAGYIMDLVEEHMVAPVVAVSAIKVTGVMAVDTTIPIERNTIAILIRFLE
ncbi:hypothetical protein CK203_102529 [Vitis vinifera]|uniref:Uncharacterized protein n=1 Tax=Vitis vinifera TaxID=29760 RepID=A0A438DV01_VITVI|nr:hypothetical protein CK203_102529 [Vitis vinifera]